MRIAFVLSALQAGGAERVVNLISAAALERGWDVTIISFDAPGDAIFHTYDTRIVLKRLNIRAGATRLLPRIAALRGTLRRGRFDRVISFLTKINVVSLAAAVGLKIPLIVSERNNPSAQRVSPFWNGALALLYPRASNVVMQTRRSISCLPPRQRLRAVVIPNPVSMLPGEPKRGSGRNIVAVGRLTEQKGFDLLIAAFVLVAAEAPDWKLFIWGEGPERASLQRQVAAAQLENRVFLPGLSAAPGSWTSSADIFVLSSRYEGFPNALIEAMAAGLPIVSFDCAFGPAELIEHERSGMLVPDGSVPHLAKSLLSLMTDGSRRASFALSARAAAEQYAGDRVIPAWLDLIASSSNAALK